MRPIGRRGFVTTATGAAFALLGADVSGAVDRRPARGWPGRAGDFRGVWVATVANRDWPSRPGLTAGQQRAELLGHLDRAAARRLNAVVLQVRPAADALWPSRYEPWAQCLTGTQGRDPGWDPLGTAVEEAHARGLALHAWFNPYRVATHADPARLAPGHPARRHPEWTVVHGGKLYYNPGLPEVRRFVQDAMLDAVRRYDVDAVHWDDYFYPYPVAGQRFDDDAAYAEHGGGFADRGDWRRHNTDLLVSEMGARIKAVKPRVEFGISPFGVWRNRSADPEGSDTRAGVGTYDDLYADTRKWVRERWIDHIVPQLYWHIGQPGADYAVLLDWWNATVRGTSVGLRIGEALYKAGDPAQAAAWQDPAELSRHLALAERRTAVDGHCFFAAQDVAKDRIGAFARLVEDHYA
ncbi:glycoside hydrolase family 10 protein [Streptomyces termitum]